MKTTNTRIATTIASYRASGFYKGELLKDHVQVRLDPAVAAFDAQLNSNKLFLAAFMGLKVVMAAKTIRHNKQLDTAKTTFFKIIEGKPIKKKLYDGYPAFMKEIEDLRIADAAA